MSILEEFWSSAGPFVACALIGQNPQLRGRGGTDETDLQVKGDGGGCYALGMSKCGKFHVLRRWTEKPAFLDVT